MNLTVNDGDDAVSLGLAGGRRGERVRLQNLGTGDLYVDHDSGVTAASGFKVVPDGEVEVLADGCFVYADGDVDLRIVTSGS